MYTLEIEIIDITIELSGYGGGHPELGESRGEESQGAHTHGAATDGSRHADRIDEVRPRLRVLVAHHEIGDVDVRPIVDEPQIFDYGFAVADLRAAGKMSAYVAALFQERHLVAGAGHYSAFHSQVPAFHVDTVHFQVVPVHSVITEFRSVAVKIPHREFHVFETHVADTEDFFVGNALFRVRISAEPEDALEVHLRRRAVADHDRFDDQIKLTVGDLRRPDADVAAQERPETELRRHVPGPEKCVHPALVWVFVNDCQVFDNYGFERIGRDFSDLYVSVNALVQCGEDFVREACLDGRRLQGDNARDDERHE